MARSVQMFRGRYANFNDFDLFAIINLASASGLAGELAPVLDAWRASFAQWGPGVIDLRLDQLRPVALELLRNCLRRILATIKVEPTSLSTQNWTAPTGVRFVENYSAPHARDAIAKLIGLIEYPGCGRIGRTKTLMNFSNRHDMAQVRHWRTGAPGSPHHANAPRFTRCSPTTNMSGERQLS